MATPLTASRLVRALRNEGLRVVEHGSWRTHNRNHKGPWGPVHGVQLHHTVTTGTERTVRICRDGYSGLPGPLCLGVIAKDGTVHLIGYGRANHAGLGDGDVLRAVIAERATLPEPTRRNTDGNARFYGFECVNLGDGEDPWTDEQLLAIEKASAAICRAHGWNERSVIGHKEWTNTKIDPRGFSMSGMRTRIGKRLGKAPQADAPAGSGTYTVEKGDTLWSIAQEELGDGARYRDIARLNGVKNADEIEPGDVLQIPGKTTTPSATKPPAKKPVVDLSRLIAAARRDPPKAGTPVSYSGVKVVEAALVAEGLLAQSLADGHFGTATVSAYAAWQRRCDYTGSDADGIPGKDSLTRLGKARSFTVKE